MITEDWGARARAAIRDLMRLDVGLEGMDARWLALIAPVLILVAIAKLWRRRVREVAAGFDPRALALRAAILEAFEYLGVPRSGSVPLETHVERARTIDQDAGAVIAEAITSLNHATFGSGTPDSVEWGRIHRRLARYRRSKFRLFRLRG